jgi:hypothetical protein
MRQIALAGFAVLVAFPAAAIVNLEYGMEYEQAYLDQCSISHSERACRCSMEALEEKVGFQEFAEQVAIYGKQMMERSDLRDLTTDLIARCTAVGTAQ